MADGHMDAKVLRRAAELVDQGWCQHALARDASGTGCNWEGPSAVAWCVVGAHSRAIVELGAPELAGWDALCAEIPTDSRADWNNAKGRTADEVAAALRAAADRCASPTPEAEAPRGPAPA